MIAAATQRSTRMRIGHAVALLPFHNPVMVAERIATLDLIADGRIDVGVGRGLSPLEFDVFGGSIDESRERVDEGSRSCAAAGARARLVPGQIPVVPEIDVVPKPIQKPHPPLWTAAVSPETFALAADRDLGVLAGPFKPLFMVAEDRDRFVARCEELVRTRGRSGSR